MKERDPWGDLGVDGRDLADSGYVPAAGCCERGDEPSESLAGKYLFLER
jgi:hypothetical protein